MKKYWSSKEVDYLQKHYGLTPIKDLAIIFNTTYEKVVDKAHKIGLNSKLASGELWNEEEDQIVREHFEYAPKSQLEKLLPNRTWAAILQRGIKIHNLKRISQDRYDVDYNFFSEWTADSAYAFGFIAADGFIFYGHKNAIQIELNEKDKDILEKLKDKMHYEGIICSSGRKTVKLQINNKKMVLDLINKGMPLKDKTHLISYPVTLPDNLLSHFIRGVFDGDGSIYKHGRYFRIQLLGSYELLKGIKDKLPFDLTKNSIRYRGKNGGADVWELSIAGKKAVDIAEWMYEGADIYLQRKYKIKEQLKMEFEKKYTKGKFKVSKTQHKINNYTIMGFNFISETKLPNLWPIGPIVKDGSLKLSIHSCKEAIETKQALKEIVNELTKAISEYCDTVAEEINPIPFEQLMQK